jgi:serine/threonine protein phosphatase PrpC
MKNIGPVRSFGRSDTGPVRRGNEDGFVVDQSLGLFVVADGMGGHNAGEVASRLALETIAGFIRRSNDEREFSWPCGILPTLSYDGNRLRTAVYLANRRVFRTAESQDEYLGMGTTVVAALASGGRVVIAHVGDSRAYLWRSGVLDQLTRDDSWVATVLAADLTADPQSFANHPMRNVLTNVLGAREDSEVHMQDHAVEPGDVLLLCTDGVHGVLDADAIAPILGRAGEAEKVADALIAAALSRGSRDNMTALIVEFNRNE